MVNAMRHVKTLTLALLAITCLVFLSTSRALAVVEFCPASLRIEPVGEGQVKRPSALYGFALNAFGPRTVSAVLAFETDGGWFTATVPAVTLMEIDRQYNGPSNGFVDREWVSPPAYVRFPRTVTIIHTWVSSAMSLGDSFGWSGRGPVTCEPNANGDVRRGLRTEDRIRLYNEDHLNAQPSIASVILDAQPSTPHGQADCARPFSDPNTLEQVPAAYTGILAAEGAGGDAGIIVAIDATGHLVDAWVWAPSGQKQFDDAALAAARKSTYEAGTAYCKPVPGLYLFWATFSGD